MATKYVQIDFENVQRKKLLKKHSFRIFVFCGANQARIPPELADIERLRP